MANVKLRFKAKTITAVGVFEKGAEVALPREDADKIIGLTSVEVIEGLKVEEPKLEAPKKKRKKKDTE